MQIYFKYVKAMHSAFGSQPLPCYFGVEDLIDITMEGAGVGALHSCAIMCTYARLWRC